MNPKVMRLDAIDIQILSDLQKNGRMTNVELAKRVGISAPPCLRRVRVLEEAGYIKSYHAEIDPQLLGFSVTIFAFVGLSSQKDNDLRAFETLVESWSEVRDCFMLAGDSDFLLKIVTRNWDEYQQFLARKLTSAPNVAQVKSSLAVRHSKSEVGVPIEVAVEQQYSAAE
jgi:DNA-binding Lrp family transcriptional regulator